MNGRTLRIALLVFFSGLLLVTAAVAQDFQKSYSLTADGTIRIRSISGEIRIIGSDSPKVEVEGFKVGRNRDRVEIVDRSAENRIDVDVRYPENSGGDASVNFKVSVPRSVKYNFELIRSVSGNVHVSGVSGRLKAESISGSVQLQDISGVVSASSVSGNVNVQNVSGTVSASSTSGNVDVYLKRIEGPGDMEFRSISGGVIVKVPASLDANVTMSTLSGRLTTDFDIEVLQRRYSPGYSARGRLGEGTHSIRIASVSGRVSLLKDTAK